MRTVAGRTDRIVVVGAGLSGLAAAMHLAGRQREVTVLERATVPGGRAGRMDVGEFRLDTGPTVLTMPDIIDETFAAVGESLAGRMHLVALSPAYQACFADGSTLAVHSDADAMADEVAGFAGPTEARGYLNLRRWLTQMYEATYDQFIAANIDSPLSLVSPQLARLAALGGFSTLDRQVSRFVHDDRLKRVFTFQSLYAGVAPQRALAIYGVIAYMDTIGGVFFPRGGVRALPDALAAAATDAGVDFHYGETAVELERNGTHVTAVRTANGRRFPCDAVILTTEPHVSYRLLGRTPNRPVRLQAAPSAVVAHLSVRRQDIAHHTISFGAAWRETFAEIIDRGRTMTDPSLLITRPTATDPALAPAGRDLVSVLAPVPNLDRGRIDWDRLGDRYAEEILRVLAERLPGLTDGAQLLHTITPADWADQDMTAGTPFSYAHSLTQTGPFRPGNFPRHLANAVLAGGGTVPGVGVPTALISGRLAADRITGTRSGPVRTTSGFAPGGKR